MRLGIYHGIPFKINIIKKYALSDETIFLPQITRNEVGSRKQVLNYLVSLFLARRTTETNITSMTIRLICMTHEAREGVDPLLCFKEIGGVNEQTGEVKLYRPSELHDLVTQGNNIYMNDIFGNKVKVAADITSKGEKFIRTIFNNEKTDELLKLSSCITFK